MAGPVLDTPHISPKPHVALVIGLQGTGKTTVAKGLATALGWEMVTTEAIRGRLYPMTLTQKDADFSEEEMRLSYEVVNLLVDHLLRNSVSVIVDGVFRSITQRNALLDVARSYGASVTAFCTRCPDEEVIRRLSLRQASPTPSPGGVMTYHATKSCFDEAPPTFLSLDTARPPAEITKVALTEINRTRGLAR